MSDRRLGWFFASAFLSNLVWAFLWAKYYPEGGDFAIWLYAWVDHWPGNAVYFIAFYVVPFLMAALTGLPFSVWSRKTPFAYKVIGIVVCILVRYVAMFVWFFIEFFFGCPLVGHCNPIGY